MALFRNAVRRLKGFTDEVWYNEFECAALLGGHIITFWQDRGRVAGVRYGRAGEDDFHGRPVRTVTEAMREALRRRIGVRLPCGVLIVSVVHEGRALTPTASFLVMFNDPSGIDVKGHSSRSTEALGMAEAVLDEDVEQEVLLDWLTEHGGDVGQLVLDAR
jgi:hypothetical protein